MNLDIPTLGSARVAARFSRRAGAGHARPLFARPHLSTDPRARRKRWRGVLRRLLAMGRTRIRAPAISRDSTTDNGQPTTREAPSYLEQREFDGMEEAVLSAEERLETARRSARRIRRSRRMRPRCRSVLRSSPRRRRKSTSISGGASWRRSRVVCHREEHPRARSGHHQLARDRLR